MQNVLSLDSGVSFQLFSLKVSDVIQGKSYLKPSEDVSVSNKLSTYFTNLLSSLIINYCQGCNYIYCVTHHDLQIVFIYTSIK